MFLNGEGPIAGGRELWGFPKKLAQPTLRTEIDTLVGTTAISSEFGVHKERLESKWDLDSRNTHFGIFWPTPKKRAKSHFNQRAIALA
jgi:hypothetical protein